MGLLQNVGNFLGGVGRSVGNFFRPQQPIKPPPSYNLGQFLQQHLGAPAAHLTQNLTNKIAQVPKIRLQGIEQLTGKQGYNVGNAYNDVVQKPVVNPVLRGGQALNQVGNNMRSGQAPLKGIKVREFAADAATTGLNFASLGKGKSLLEGGGKLGAKILHGAKSGALLGGAQGGVQGFRDNTNARGYATNIAGGAALGGALGAATPVVGAGARGLAREGRAAIKQAPQILRDERGFARVPNVGKQSSKARANMAADPDVPPIPSPAKRLPKYQMKPEGKLAKAFLPTVDIIKRQGLTGQKLGKLVDSATDTHETYQGELTAKIPTVLKGLNRKERANFGDVVEGKTKAISPAQAKAVREWQKVAPTIRERGLQAGLDIGDQSGPSGKNYFPHLVDFEKLGKPNRFNQAVNHLVDTKQAKTPEEAVQLLNYARDVARNRPNGNLEAARLVDLPGYDKSPSALSGYISGATKRIAHAETFGAKDEHAIKLLTKIAKEGGDSAAAKNAFDIAVGAKKYDSNLISPKTSGKIRSFNTLTKLGTAAISNATQSVNTATVAGYHRTAPAVFKALTRSFTPEQKSFVQKSGVVADALLSDLREQQGVSGWVGKVGAPGFGTVEKANRTIAALTGRRWANELAEKGDAKSLKTLTEKLGVEGKIGKKLTEPQQIQAARKLVEISQFKTGAKDLPGWVNSPEGKLVAQFRTFQYKQTGFLYKEILKPASKGNLLPLTRFLAALPLGYGAYEAKNILRNRPDDEGTGRKVFEAFQQLGGAGLPGSLTQSLVPRFGKYLPPGVYASQVAGALGGPTVSTLGRYADALGSAAAKGDFKPAGRVALGTIPFVGGTLSNTLLPYDSVGNRMNPAQGKTTGTASAASSGSASTPGADTGLLDDNTTQAYKDAKKKETQTKKDQVAAGTRLGGTESLDSAQQRIDTAQKKFNPSLSQESKDALTRYAKLSEDGRKKLTPAQEHAVNKAKFENDYRNGGLTDMELYKRQTQLGKEAVTSQFSREAQELYGMSKANREAFLGSFPEYSKFMDEAAKLDSALAAKGWIKTAKLSGGGTRGAKKAAKLSIRLKTRKHKTPTFGSYKASKKLKVKL